MWSQLIEDIQLELKLLRRLLEQCEPLREAVANETATETEKLAAASLLQSFYNGVENVFDLLADRIDGHRPTGPDRHQTLLAKMGQPTDARPAVLSKELAEGLGQYLEFRNSYRYSHYFRLDWSLMAALVNQSAATLDRLEAELDRFVREHGKRRFLGRAEPQGLPAYWFSPPSRARGDRPSAVRAPYLLWAIAGLAVGFAALAAIQYAHRRAAAPKEAGAAEMRGLAASLAKQIQPWRAEPHVRHVLGVLGFFERPDWRFAYAGGRRAASGDVTGRCESLDASATFSFAKGNLAGIDIRTSWEHYAFSIRGGRLRRAAHYALLSDRPRQIAEFASNGCPTYLGEWREDDDRPTRRDRFFHAGKLLLETVSRADGSVERAVVRTGAAPEAGTVFAGTKAGLLVRDPNAAAAMKDLLPTARTQPTSGAR